MPIYQIIKSANGLKKGTPSRRMASLFIIYFLIIINPSVIAQEWLTDINQAMEKARQEDKYVLIYFSGSDWCAPCIRFKKEILNTEYFAAKCAENFILIEADFPRNRKNRLEPSQIEHNDRLAEKYNQQGIFPLIVIVDHEGKVLGKTGYEKTSPELYLHKLTVLIK